LNPTWWENAACKDADSRIFFDPFLAGEAGEYCDRCPVRSECLKEASEKPTIGFFGGKWFDLYGIELRESVKEEYRSLIHGTDQGYYLHRRLSEKACEACMQAHREHNREMYNEKIEA
jgi:hypothetical protein